MAGMLHDVGKMFVPEAVLNKAGPLEDTEWGLLRDHPKRGYEHLIAQGVTNDLVLRVTLEHHERMDGTGYPGKLNGGQIHRMSQICAVVDSFDAMTACRPFKNRVKSVAEAVTILQSETPGKYDADVVKGWVDLLKRASNDGLLKEPVEEAPPAPGQLGRRAHKRYVVQCAGKLFPRPKPGGGGGDVGGAQKVIVHNISQGGLGILCPKPLEPTTLVRVQIDGKGTLEGRVLEGQVVRCRAYGDGQFEVGIRKYDAEAEGAAAAKVAAAGSGGAGGNGR
jgi:hypothetical protein